jgi:hypothetical protein
MAKPVIDDTTLDFNAMTIAQLHDEALRLASVLDLVNAQRKTVLDLMNARKRDVVMRERVTAMTAEARDAMRTVLADPAFVARR